jgi:hypothetical protein
MPWRVVAFGQTSDEVFRARGAYRTGVRVDPA